MEKSSSPCFMMPMMGALHSDPQKGECWGTLVPPTLLPGFFLLLLLFFKKYLVKASSGGIWLDAGRCLGGDEVVWGGCSQQGVRHGQRPTAGGNTFPPMAPEFCLSQALSILPPASSSKPGGNMELKGFGETEARSRKGLFQAFEPPETAGHCPVGRGFSVFGLKFTAQWPSSNVPS